MLILREVQSCVTLEPSHVREESAQSLVATRQRALRDTPISRTLYRAHRQQEPRRVEVPLVLDQSRYNALQDHDSRRSLYRVGTLKILFKAGVLADLEE